MASCLINKRTKSKTHKPQDEKYLSGIKGSPLLNKNEIDKRQTFKEIVSGFPFAAKQKMFVESINKNSQIITDRDVEMYQNIKGLKRRETFGKNMTRLDSKKNVLRETQSLEKSTKEFEQPKGKGIAKPGVINDKLSKSPVKESGTKAVYISSRISK